MKAGGLYLISMNMGKQLASPIQKKSRKRDDPQTSVDYVFYELAFSDKVHLYGSIDPVDVAHTI